MQTVPRFSDFPGTPETLTAPFLTEVLRANGIDAEVSSIDVERIGTGQIGMNARITLNYAGETKGPRTLVGKFPSPDPQGSTIGFEGKLYFKEATFYREFAPLLREKGMGVARCWAAECDMDIRKTLILLDDVAPLEAGDQLAGCGLDICELAVQQAAIMHATYWQHPALLQAEWVDKPDNPEKAKASKDMFQFWLPSFFDRYKARMSPQQIDIMTRFGTVFDKWILSRESGPWTLQHADFRLDNVLIPPKSEMGKPDRMVTVDFQTVACDLGGIDVGFFIAGSISPEERRKHERRLTELWHSELVRLGVKDYSLDQAWDAYRHGQWRGLLTAVSAAMVATRTDRGDEIFWLMTDRHLRTILETNALELLPKE